MNGDDFEPGGRPPRDGPPRGGPAAGGADRHGPAPPHSLEAEREVLAAVLVDPNAMDAVSETLQADDFYFERHQLIFEALAELHEHNTAIDPVTLQQALKDRGNYDKIGGARAIGELLDRAGTVANIEHYCAIVRQKAVLRRMVDAARAIEVAGYADVADVDEFLDEAERSVFAVLEDRASQNLRPIGEVVSAAIDQITAAFDAEGDITGIGTGFRDWDRMTHGLQRGDLVIVAARPAMGKTSFVLNVAVNAALKHEASVAVFSLEMPSEQLAQRLLAAEARIDLSRLRGGYIDEDGWPRLNEAADRVARVKMYLDDTPGITPTQIRAKCRRLKRREGLDLVIIDYLQLMGAGMKHGSREQEISYISRSLKGLAKDLSAPVIALSQLNRSLESRTDKRPLMSDLRESGAIEQDADMICFIYRDEVYNKEIPEDQKGIAELIVGKHRNGPTGTVKLKFTHAWTRFDNLALQTGP
ncbi:MAG: replicative DNA helicase [Deltaproteobacteria bacterium]|nr:replicative DNA helicase [Deltaproteobacteria bacterium]